MQNPKNIKKPQKIMKVCIITFKIVNKMNKRQPSLIIFSISTFLESRINNRRSSNKTIKDNSLYGEKTLGTHITMKTLLASLVLALLMQS